MAKVAAHHSQQELRGAESEARRGAPEEQEGQELMAPGQRREPDPQLLSVAVTGT